MSTEAVIGSDGLSLNRKSYSTFEILCARWVASSKETPRWISWAIIGEIQSRTKQTTARGDIFIGYSQQRNGSTMVHCSGEADLLSQSDVVVLGLAS